MTATPLVPLGETFFSIVGFYGLVSFFLFQPSTEQTQPNGNLRPPPADGCAKAPISLFYPVLFSPPTRAILSLLQVKSQRRLVVVCLTESWTVEQTKYSNPPSSVFSSACPLCIRSGLKVDVPTPRSATSPVFGSSPPTFYVL